MTEFNDRFATEAACRDYLVGLRWPDGFDCPRCGARKGWPIRGRGLVQCAGCGHQASVTAGTIFQDTPKPLRLWFQAIWLVTSQKHGASAQSLQQVLGLGSYETAWTWLHKLRAAMVRPDRDRLVGPVEVDEAWVGGQDPDSLGGRHTNSKAIVAVAAEERGRGLGRIRLKRIYATDGANLLTFIEEVVTPGSVVHTDDLQLARMRVGPLTNDFASTPDQILGLAIRRTLRSGQPIALADLGKPVLVAKGARVALQLQSGALIVSASGQAMESGALGDRITVLNPTSRAVIEAEIVGAGKVRVLPDSATIRPPGSTRVSSTNLEPAAVLR